MTKKPIAVIDGDLLAFKSAAALYVKNVFEEKSAEFQKVNVAYETYAD